ncbi:hypothetical protein P691DRAFT_658575 [Macrolepiota fuliginosa MF-IS2]|uniref:Regulator of volume decrease after cellular swelling-domain-containing protein n=1 Tax=Macrolepiota fuliginosa MF-IS2 TaxID=1400762 RepID=A0A9P5XL50_9AGAR|nr:hypothetical protein P691DRAFT_658575 [Macrolepiota fuliginosa MF-IS2]
MSAIQIVAALPTFVTQDEHTSIVASTPNSFNDIPPVIKHKEENVTVVLDPPLPEFSGDELKGTLYVLSSALVFFSASERGFQVEYPSITLHAVSRGEPGPSIYCQLDESNTRENVVEEEEYSDMRELSIIPGSSESLESIFEALSYCASLHPDEDAEGEDDEFDSAFVDPGTFETFNGDESEELSEVGRVRSDFLNNNRYAPY